MAGTQHDRPADKRVRRRFTWSASVAAVLLLALAGLTLAVRTTPLPLDSAALTWALDHRVPWATTIAVAVTTTGSGLPAYVLAALAGVIARPRAPLDRHGRRRAGPARGGRCPPAPGDMAPSATPAAWTSGSPAQTVLRSRPGTPPPRRSWPRCCAPPWPAGSAGADAWLCSCSVGVGRRGGADPRLPRRPLDDRRRGWLVARGWSQRARLCGGPGTSSHSAHVAGVAEGEPARLGPHAQAVRPGPTGIRLIKLPGARVDDVDDRVVAPREPQLAAVGGDAAHVRGARRPAGATWSGPSGSRRPGPMTEPSSRLETKISERVAAGVDAVSALPGGQEAADPEGCARRPARRRCGACRRRGRSCRRVRGGRPAASRSRLGRCPARARRCIAVIGSVAPGVLIALRSMTDSTFRPLAGTTRSLPLNSQLTTNAVRSAVKSAWLTPRQGTCSDRCSFIVLRVAEVDALAAPRPSRRRASRRG